MHIAFEGPIAAGKTTLAKLLANRIGIECELLLEDFNGNEFLQDFYANPPRWSLPMQLDFLISRHSQFRHATRSPKHWLIADHSMRKDEIFAHFLLRDRESRLYDRVAKALAGDIAEPDLLVYLDAPTETLLERIHSRGRPYESHIDDDYLNRLRGAYGELLEFFDESRVVTIDTSTFEASTESDVSEVFDKILAKAEAIGQGTATTL